MDRCSICLNNLGYRKRLKLDCNHNFHFKCIFKWIKINNSCPICRESVIEIEETNSEIFFFTSGNTNSNTDVGIIIILIILMSFLYTTIGILLYKCLEINKY